MDLAWLYDVLALAQHKSFSRAAEARHVTQGAFSRRIRSLEGWAGVPLFDRRTHAVKLTKAGERFVLTAEDTLRCLFEGKEAAKQEGGLFEPTVRVAATHSLALTFFSSWIHSCSSEMKRMAKIQLFSDSTQACENMLISGEAQFMLCHYHPVMRVRLNRPQFQSICIGKDELMPVSAPDSSGRPRYRLSSTISDAVPLLAYGEPSGLGQIMKSVLASEMCQYSLRPVFTSHMANVLATLARNGDGVAWVPRSLIEADLRDGALVRAGDARFNVAIQIQIFRPRSRQRPECEDLWQRINGRQANVIPLRHKS